MPRVRRYARIKECIDHPYPLPLVKATKYCGYCYAELCDECYERTCVAEDHPSKLGKGRIYESGK